MDSHSCLSPHSLCKCDKNTQEADSNLASLLGFATTLHYITLFIFGKDYCIRYGVDFITFFYLSSSLLFHSPHENSVNRFAGV